MCEIILIPIVRGVLAGGAGGAVAPPGAGQFSIFRANSFVYDRLDYRKFEKYKIKF